MTTAIIFDIILLALLIAAGIMLNKTWIEKEHYRCRVFDLTNGEEGSNLVKVVPDTPPPPAAIGLFPTDKEPEPHHERSAGQRSHHQHRLGTRRTQRGAWHQLFMFG